MCVHAFSSVWVLNHDGWQGEEQRARVCVHRDSVHLHPSPVNAAAAPLRLWDTLLTSQWILGDLSCGVTEFKPRMYAIHNSIFIFLLAFICWSFYFRPSFPFIFPLFLLPCLTIIIFCVPSSASFHLCPSVYNLIALCLLRPSSICLLVCSSEMSSVTFQFIFHIQVTTVQISQPSFSSWLLVSLND